MLTKLALRNAGRSIKDYLVYLITMTAIAGMMFAFNSLIFSEDIQRLCTKASMLAVMLGLFTFFIILIVAWLINYIAKFMLEKRSREFATYLLLGLKKKEISGLYMKENLLMGTSSFLLGLGFGIFLQQIIMTLFYRVFEMEYKMRVEIDGWCMLMTTCCYFGCYLLALRKNRRVFCRLTIAGLLQMEKESDEIKEGKERLKQWLFFIAVAYMAVAYAMMFLGIGTVGTAFLLIGGFIAAIYILYYGLSAFLICRIKKGSKGIYKKNRLFLLRQMASKIKAMRFTMGTLTVLLVFSLLGGTFSLIFSRCQNEYIDYAMPFDILVYGRDAETEFDEELAVIRANADPVETCIYQIYENQSTQMNRYFYTHVPVLLSYEEDNEAASYDAEKKWREYRPYETEKTWREYYLYDTCMRLSDYNRLRAMLGYEQIHLEEGFYALQTKERLVEHLGEGIYEQKLQAGEKSLELSNIYTDAFSQNGLNGADYLMIVPDEIVDLMTPYYSMLAVDIEGEADMALYEALLSAYRERNGLISREEFDRKIETGELGDSAVMEESVLGAIGTDQIISIATDVMVRDIDAPDMKFIVTALVFPLAYIGLIFVCVAMTILAVQQLSDSSKYRFRYDVLRKLGLKERELDKLVFSQLTLFYLIPAALAAAVSMTVAVYAGNQIVKFTGIEGNGWYYFGLSLLLFVGIYILYFTATYLGFLQNIRRKQS